ncbi:unnamed protein product, partial [Nesidiocoris tenuis]
MVFVMGGVKNSIHTIFLFQTLQMGQGMNDNQWHSVSYSRRAEAINLQVDAETPIR